MEITVVKTVLMEMDTKMEIINLTKKNKTTHVKLFKSLKRNEKEH